MNINDCKDCFAVRGETIIDVLHPTTGLTVCFGKTLEDCRKDYPNAEKMTVDEFCASKAARQDSPVEWVEITEERYWNMLECVPPAMMTTGAFLVGEPTDHHAGNGQPRFSGFRQDTDGKFLETSRPVTRKEMWSLLFSRMWSMGKSIADMEKFYGMKIETGCELSDIPQALAGGNFTVSRN